MNPLDDFLRLHDIEVLRVEHPAVMTVAEAALLVPEMAGAKAKNLFLREGKTDRFLLAVVPYEKRVDLEALARALGSAKLTLASTEQLLSVLAVTPGAVSLLALFNDKEHRAKPVLDRLIWEAEGLQCHPLVNTATLSLTSSGLRHFLANTGHEPMVLDVPTRDQASAA